MPSAEVARQQAADNGWDVHVVELDVTDDASVGAAVAQVLTLGELDTVVNNAGATGSGLLESFTATQVAELFEINTLGAVRVNQAVLPHLRALGRSLLIHITSGSDRVVMPVYGPYMLEPPAR